VRAQQAGIPTGVVDYKAHLQRAMDNPLELDLPVNLQEPAHRRKILKMPDPEKLLLQLMLAEQELIGVLDSYQVIGVIG
jgi:hypothetical protein